MTLTTTTQKAEPPHFRRDRTWIDTREQLPLTEAIDQLQKCPVPLWSKDIHIHRHCLHTYYHDALDSVPKEKSEVVQPYATLAIFFT